MVEYRTDEERLSAIINFFNDYKKFKSSHLKYIKNRKSISSTKSEKNFSLKFFFKKIINRIQYGPKRKNLTTSLNKPYAVILLSKNINKNKIKFLTIIKIFN